MGCPWVRGAPQNIEVPLLIFTHAMAETWDFKLGTQLGFANAHHKTTLRGKVSVALGASVYLGLPFNISATAALSS